jgi:hypothetical protein
MISIVDRSIAEISVKQLPISTDLQKSFPNINSDSVVIINKEAEVVLYERRSDRKINDNTTLLDACIQSFDGPKQDFAKTFNNKDRYFFFDT